MHRDIAPSPIAVLGGSGFIGTRLVGRLIELGHEPRIGDLEASTTFPDRHFPCDVRRAATLESVLAGAGIVMNLAAEHRDDVRPVSRYHETNVEGARQVCLAAEEAGIKKLIFTSSVAVYGFHSFPVDEGGPFEPFNPYGETKLLAEGIYRTWAEEDPTRSLVIIRPTVVFGEGNRGNVYNLLRQIASGRFMMVGPGTNRKSMAYVGNVAECLVHAMGFGPGIHIYNCVDGPDMNMNDLVALVYDCLGRSRSRDLRVPLGLAIAGGHLMDVVSRFTRTTFPVSAIRVRKFTENTQFNGTRLLSTGFKPPYGLKQALASTIQAEFKNQPGTRADR